MVTRRSSVAIHGNAVRTAPDCPETVLRALRQNGVTAHFTAGGYFPSLRPVETLALLPDLDSIVRFEGKETLVEFRGSLDRPERQGVRVFLFQDDDFAVRTPRQRAWLQAYLEALDDAGLSERVKWISGSRSVESVLSVYSAIQTNTAGSSARASVSTTPLSLNL